MLNRERSDYCRILDLSSKLSRFYNDNIWINADKRVLKRLSSDREVRDNDTQKFLGAIYDYKTPNLNEDSVNQSIIQIDK